jgi:hypothetical protein
MSTGGTEEGGRRAVRDDAMDTDSCLSISERYEGLYHRQGQYRSSPSPAGQMQTRNGVDLRNRR